MIVRFQNEFTIRQENKIIHLVYIKFFNIRLIADPWQAINRYEMI